MPLSIRIPTLSDYPRIAEVINTREDRIIALYDQSEYWDNFGPTSAFQLELRSSGLEYRIAEQDGMIVGFVSYYRKPNGVMWIADLVVHPDWQRRGIGTALVQYVEAEGEKLRSPAVALETQDRFTWAIAFCEALGFTRLNWSGLNRPPYTDTLVKPPVSGAVVFGKLLK